MASVAEARGLLIAVNRKENGTVEFELDGESGQNREPDLAEAKSDIQGEACSVRMGEKDNGYSLSLSLSHTHTHNTHSHTHTHARTHTHTHNTHTLTTHIHTTALLYLSDSPRGIVVALWH